MEDYDLEAVFGGKPEVRYIKLGKNNMWAERAIRDCEIPLSFKEVPHELASTLDEQKIARHLIASGKTAGPAMAAARQVCTFYSLDDNAIWITFVDGLMWWTTAEREVIWRGVADEYAPRIRNATGWVCANKFNVPFYVDGLSSRLTKVASTQMTLCKVEAANYVLRKIVNFPEPAVLEAMKAKERMRGAILGLVADLHWTDFETLCDLLLARSGWHRVTALGGNLKDVDMIAEQAITQQRAFVQVKSAAGQKELDHYTAIFERSGCSLMIFACHSPTTFLSSRHPGVVVWAADGLADIIMAHGLFDWLVNHVR